MAETMTALGFYAETARDVAALPVIEGEKTAGERFAGALRTYTIEAMMRDGRALQSGTSHYLGTNFAKAFDITYANEQGVEEHCHTTSWGLSTRLIGGVIMGHGDDKGLILPPRLAPHQVVVVPISRGGSAGDVEAAASSLAAGLRERGVRVHVDDRPHLSPGFKYNEWELRGVPLRVEIGPRDLAAGVVTVASRLTGSKEPLPTREVAGLPDLLEDFQRDLYERALRFREDHTAVVDDVAAFDSAVATGFAVALHCGRPECEEQIKDRTTATPRAVPTDGEPASGRCFQCGEPSAYGMRIVFGRAY
jgi:prolyl-tRNA synthetase